LKDSLNPQDIFFAEIGNEKDYIATRVSYLMDFTGPSMNVNSACSSALVAVAQAGAAISFGQCDAGVAGGSSVTFPNLGYLYQDGLVHQ
jgi:acyl transferase domain-containing protein